MSDSQSVAPTTTPITLEDAKRHLNVSTTDGDSDILNYINSATRMIERRVNRSFVNQTRVLKMNTFDDPRYVHDRVIYPPTAPLSSVSSIAYVDSAGTTQTLSTTAYRYSTGDEPGRIAEEYSNTWPATRNVLNDVSITYVCGESSGQSGISAEVKQAVRLVVGHYYRNREAVTVDQGITSVEIQLGLDALLENTIETYG